MNEASLSVGTVSVYTSRPLVDSVAATTTLLRINRFVVVFRLTQITSLLTN